MISAGACSWRVDGGGRHSAGRTVRTAAAARQRLGEGGRDLCAPHNVKTEKMHHRQASHHDPKRRRQFGWHGTFEGPQPVSVDTGSAALSRCLKPPYGRSGCRLRTATAISRSRRQDISAPRHGQGRDQAFQQAVALLVLFFIDTMQKLGLTRGRPSTAGAELRWLETAAPEWRSSWRRTSQRARARRRNCESRTGGTTGAGQFD